MKLTFYYYILNLSYMKHFLVFLLVFIGIGSVSAQQAKIYRYGKR